MTWIHLTGYGFAFLMGLTLGLIGAGGSILAVPIMVYFFSVKPVLATAYSLLIVGSTAAVGSFRYWLKGMVSVRDAIIFALPAMTMVLITRRFIVPSIPDPALTLYDISLSKDGLIMIVFSTLMLLAGWYMFKPASPHIKPVRSNTVYATLRLIAGSGLIGLITGVVGAGGGFLIVPTLMGLFGLPMKMAIGTSLGIIAINSLVGFNGDLLAGIEIDWSLIGFFMTCTISGMLAGTWLSQYVDSSRLKKGFAVFILLTAASILAEQIYNF